MSCVENGCGKYVIVVYVRKWVALSLNECYHMLFWTSQGISNKFVCILKYINSYILHSVRTNRRRLYLPQTAFFASVLYAALPHSTNTFVLNCFWQYFILWTQKIGSILLLAIFSTSTKDELNTYLNDCTLRSCQTLSPCNQKAFLHLGYTRRCW